MISGAVPFIPRPGKRQRRLATADVGKEVFAVERVEFSQERRSARAGQRERAVEDGVGCCFNILGQLEYRPQLQFLSVTENLIRQSVQRLDVYRMGVGKRRERPFEVGNGSPAEARGKDTLGLEDALADQPFNSPDHRCSLARPGDGKDERRSQVVIDDALLFSCKIDYFAKRCPLRDHP